MDDHERDECSLAHVAFPETQEHTMRLSLSTPLAAALVMGLSACVRPGTPAGLVTRTSSAPQTRAVDSIASRLFAMGMAPGMAVAVVRGDEILYMRGFGHADVEARRPVTPETMFYIASTTKAFTGLAVARLSETGRFQLDAPISRYLPALRLPQPHSPDSVTIRSLLTHTHGIAGDGPVVWRTAFTGEWESTEQLVRLVAEHAPARAGRAYQYGNIGYNVVSFALERALGRSWKDVVDDQVLQPLGMRNTTAYVSRVPSDRLAQPYTFTGRTFEREVYNKTDANMHAAGGLVSSTRDLARWIEVQLNDGRLDGRQVISRAAVAEAKRPQAPINTTRRGLKLTEYTLGWQRAMRGDDTLFFHGGGFPGFAAHLSFFPKQRLGVIVLANEGNLGSLLVDLVGAAIYQSFDGIPQPGFDSMEQVARELSGQKARMEADLVRRETRSQPLPLSADRYSGSYVNPSFGAIHITAEGGGLRARAGAVQARSEVVDAGKHQLRLSLDGTPQLVTFEVDKDRSVALTYRGNRFVRQ